ncbi:MAG: hypothetical protein JJ992_10290 [Planctomycetes bacterium]|jgi:hypothetical protein|nr:hypothetical protein [Planctomycetota bacterium]
MFLRFSTSLLVVVVPCVFSTGAGKAENNRCLWVYAPINFQVDTDTDRLITLLTRAKRAGYDGAVITDYKFGKLDERPRNYYRNLERARATAEQLDIELIPLVMQIGYSNSILHNNPNLAAGLPVIDSEYVAHGGELTVASRRNLLDGGGFETASRNAPAGWDWIDGFGTSTKLDEQVKHSGQSALLMHDFQQSEGTGGNCRVVKRVTLKPFHQYRMTIVGQVGWSASQRVQIHAVDPRRQPHLAESRTSGRQADPGLDTSPYCVQFASARGRQYLPWIVECPIGSGVDRRRGIS